MTLTMAGVCSHNSKAYTMPRGDSGPYNHPSGFIRVLGMTIIGQLRKIREVLANRGGNGVLEASRMIPRASVTTDQTPKVPAEDHKSK
jgi:hypothetical protein